MIIRLDKEALVQSQSNQDAGIESGENSVKISEADKIINETKQKIADGSNPAMGVSPSNSGRGHDPITIEDGTDFVPTSLEEAVEEEPETIDAADSPEVTPASEKIAAELSLPQPKPSKGS